MKFEIKDTYTNKVKFVADIDCEEDTPHYTKLRLAVKYAVKNNIDLILANLEGADLSCMDLKFINLCGANLEYANLAGTNLMSANLQWANLEEAILDHANLYDVNLNHVNLNRVKLRGTNFNSANLTDTSLEQVSLHHANLSNVIGNKKTIKTLQLDTYNVVYIYDRLFIGEKSYTFEKWINFTDEEILAMDGKKALVWWKKWKPILINIIEVNPAIHPCLCDDE